MSTLAQPSATLAERASTQQVRKWGPALIVFGIGLAAWQWLLPALGVERYLLPPLSDVLQAFWDARSELLRAGWITFKEAVGGFVLGCSVAFVLALVLARWRPLGSALMPYMIAANAVPIVAFAPITNAWFGTLSPWSKVVIAAVLCFFPVLVNTLRGLTSVRPESLELMTSYAAPQTGRLRARSDPEQPAVRLLRLEDRVRTRNDRRCRGGLLRRIHRGTGRADRLGRLGGAVRDGVGGDTRREPARHRFYAMIALAERLVLSWHPSIRAGVE